MLMFQNGILATFIPEVLMVIGFLACLLSPVLHQKPDSQELMPVVAHVVTVERADISTYAVSVADFIAEIPDCEPVRVAVSGLNQQQLPLPSCFLSLSDKLTFVRFSRPPPVL